MSIWLDLWRPGQRKVRSLDTKWAAHLRVLKAQISLQQKKKTNNNKHEREKSAKRKIKELTGEKKTNIPL